jgi:ribosomal protein S1
VKKFAKHQWDLLGAQFPPGTPVSGVVTSRQPFGVFVDLEQLSGVRALLEVIHFRVPEEEPEKRFRFPDDYPNIGDRITATIIHWSQEPGEVRLTQLNVDWSQTP